MKELQDNWTPSQKQLKFASVYLNINNIRNKGDIAQEVGVCRKTLWNWMQDPSFVKWINSRKAELINCSLVDIYKMLVHKALRGDYNSCKLLLELGGEYTPGMAIKGIEPASVQIEVINSQAQAQQITKEDKEPLEAK